MKTIVHVNKHHINFNQKNQNKKPIFTIKQSGKTFYAESVEIRGPSKVVYQPDKPLSCGAHCWIETTAEVVMNGKTTFKELNACGLDKG